MPVPSDILRILGPLTDCSGWQIAKMSSHQLLELFVFDRAGADHKEIRAHMVLSDPFRKTIALHGSNDFRVAQNRSTKCLIGIRDAIEALLHEVVRVVGCLSDLLQDHFAFALDLVGREGRIAHDVRQ